mmetsp:Transcript_22205/g.34372  ORF Transcript_22205/g.34372 Transcript_22205/m.34372 type:complete len:120 (+) Transcript_22205:472-831(+)
MKQKSGSEKGAFQKKPLSSYGSSINKTHTTNQSNSRSKSDKTEQHKIMIIESSDRTEFSGASKNKMVHIDDRQNLIENLEYNEEYNPRKNSLPAFQNLAQNFEDIKKHNKRLTKQEVEE